MSGAVLLRAFCDELVRAGVEEAVICPGSRSTPLALALRTTVGLRCRVLHDERSAGFFALGMARTSRRPVVLLATSGTATVEFAPAVVEAQLARVPLVLLTADRPPELRDRGAPQTIDQDRLYGGAAKWFVEVPFFDPGSVTLDHARSVAGRAVATAMAGPAGPVQVNAPFRDPLLPDGPLAAAQHPGGGAHGDALPVPAPFTARLGGRSTLDGVSIRRLADRLASARRGLIVAGPDDDPDLPEALVALASAAGMPIVADPLSGLRAGPHDRSLVLARGDQLCRPGPWAAAHLPDLVLRTGAMPTSASLVSLLVRARPELIVLDGDGGWRESAILPATFVHADPALTVGALAAELRGRGGPGAPPRAWTDAWMAADRAADEAMARWLAAVQSRGEPFEGAVFPALADVLPGGAVLWVGNSMPVRDLDGWLPTMDRSLVIRSNRGANGIDGVVSTALGSAAVADGPVVLVVGDVSFLHDLNALLEARLHLLSATVVLVNNDGGGIFSFLPQAEAAIPGTGLPEHYEELFGTPHGVDMGPIVAALGGEHRRVAPGELATALQDSIARPGVRVLELRTDRRRNVELHREAVAVVQAVLSAGGARGAARPAEPHDPVGPGEVLP